MEKFCCICGHRIEKIKTENSSLQEEISKIKLMLKNYILNIIEEGCKNFVLGACRYFDFWAFDILISEKQKGSSLFIEVQLPFTNYTKYWDNNDIALYENMINNADSVSVLHKKYKKSCFDDRVKTMIEKADVLLTYYNGTKGWTRKYYNEAFRNGRKIINLFLL